MRRVIWLAILAILASFLAFAPVNAADAGSDPLIGVVPRITAVTSGELCFDLLCKVTATLTYSTGVGISGDAIPDFSIVDVTQKIACPVQAVTTVPPPAGVPPPIASNTLYLRSMCAVITGDIMVVIYRQTNSAGYVYNATRPQIHARSPQAFAWKLPPTIPTARTG
jgi:hypothetical protein